MKELIISLLLVSVGSVFAMDNGSQQEDKADEMLINYVPQVERIVMRMSSLTSRECQAGRKDTITKRLDSMVKTIAGTSIAWRTLNAYQDGLVFAKRMDKESIIQSLVDLKNRAETSKNNISESLKNPDSKTDKDHSEGVLLAQRSQLLDEMGAQLALYLLEVQELDKEINELKIGTTSK